MRQLLVHDFNNAAANLRAEGCNPLDLLPSLFSAQCEGCSSTASLRCAHCNLQHSIDVL